MIFSQNDVTEQNLAREMQAIVDKLGINEVSEAVFPKYFQIDNVASVQLPLSVLPRGPMGQVASLHEQLAL